MNNMEFRLNIYIEYNCHCKTVNIRCSGVGYFYFNSSSNHMKLETTINLNQLHNNIIVSYKYSSNSIAFIGNNVITKKKKINKINYFSGSQNRIL